MRLYNVDPSRSADPIRPWRKDKTVSAMKVEELRVSKKTVPSNE
jgi:hypothetical protein